MSETVWCVFQKLPADPCPSLFAICRSGPAAEKVVERSRGEQREAGEPEGEWTIRTWSVLEDDERGMAGIDQISHVLDPMRAALALPPDDAGPET